MNLRDVPEELMQSLPWSPESEAGVLGALLLNNAAWDNVGDILTVDSFHNPVAGKVFSAISALMAACKPADVITVHAQLVKQGVTDVSLLEVHEFSTSSGSPRYARHYAETVAEKFLARRLLTAVNDAQSIAHDYALPIADRIGQAQQSLESLQERSAKTSPQSIQSFVVGALDRIQALADGEVQPGIPTRIPALDRLLGGGLKPGKQMILAARPSVGKSSLAEQVCVNLALDGHAVAMFSMEMSCEEMTDRAICNVGRINMERYTLGKLDQSEWGSLSEAVERMRDLPIFFDEQAALTLQEIASKARGLKRKHDIKLLVVDYIQLCGTSNPKLSRHHQLEEISRGLKALAKTLGITILTLSQLNREVEKRASGRPVLADLKESGAIEEDADCVMLMWKHLKEMDYQINGLDCAKNRGGRTGEVALHFEGQFQRWGESTMSLSAPTKGTTAFKSNKYTEDF